MKLSSVLEALCILVLASCSSSVIPSTDADLDTPDGQTSGDTSHAVPPGCGNGVVDPGEDCDDGNHVTERCEYGELSCVVCDESCAQVNGDVSYCGDGEIDTEHDEQCDDGSSNGDAWAPEAHCNASCTELAPYCGDGRIDDAEECDGTGCPGGSSCLDECSCQHEFCDSISDPVIGTHLVFEGFPVDAALMWPHLVVAVSGQGLVTFDITDPEDPTIVSTYDEFIDPIEIDSIGSDVFVARYRGMNRVDMSDPSEPLPGGSMFGPTFFETITAADTYLAIGGRGTSTKILEAQHNDLPDFLTEIDRYFMAMTIEEGVVYGVENVGIDRMDESSLRIFSLEDPEDPAEIGQVVTPGDPRDVAVSGGYAYIADMNSVTVVDVSDPEHPTLSSTYPIDTNGIAVYGNDYLLVASYGFGVLDISDPENLVAVGHITGDLAFRVMWHDRHAFVFYGDSIDVIRLCTL